MELAGKVNCNVVLAFGGGAGLSAGYMLVALANANDLDTEAA